MAHRPGFTRAATDAPSLTGDEKSPSAGIYKTDSPSTDNEKSGFDVKEKRESVIHDNDVHIENGVPVYEADHEHGVVTEVSDAKDLLTNVLHVEDDPTLNPWTFRSFFLGIGLTIFASVLQEIYYFKPQVVYVSLVFITMIAYVIGEFMAFAIPRRGVLRYLNPGPFNSKEHAFIIIMASAGGVSALATEVLAVQKLYYGIDFNPGAAVFMTLSSQLIGYGLTGYMREILVYPTKMLWPINLPLNNLLETIHRDRRETRQMLKVFYIVFFALFVWELVPEYMAPLLIGVSIPCLARQDSLVFTNLFGGSQGNEGLGFLSLSFDWNYIAGLGSPLWYPLQTLTNSAIGAYLCVCLFMGMYYMNIYRALDFPFMSQLLFNTTSNFTNYVEYNQSLILAADNTIDPVLFAQQGVPYMTVTYIGYLITTNMGTTAAIVHLMLWNWDDLKAAWSWATPANVKSYFTGDNWKFWRFYRTEAQRTAILENPEYDPHYKLMVNYDDAPNWWFGVIFAASFGVGIGTCYALDSTLPWYGFVVACLLSIVFILFFGALYGLSGFAFNLQPVCQMIGGYMFPGKPLAGMYFTTYSYNSITQGFQLTRDLKFAQLAHLSPRATFVAQVLGAVIGGIFNYIIMLQITSSEAEVLKSIEGSNVWSGQNLQQFNTLGIAWAIASDMFSIGGRYQWVTISFLVGFAVPLPFYFANKVFPNKFWSYINMSIILWYMGYLFVGINSSITSYFLVGFIAQWWLRKYHPQLFVKYNYLLSAAMDGGTQVLVFILSFAVAGGSGVEHPFPIWALNNGGYGENKNVDFCAFNPANAG